MKTPPPVVYVAPPPPTVSPPASKRELFASQTTCAPNELCPIDPALPTIYDIRFDEHDRPCLNGLERAGCLEDDGWKFHVSIQSPREDESPLLSRTENPPAACGPGVTKGELVPLPKGGAIYWSKNGERRQIENGECRQLPPVPLLQPTMPSESMHGPELVARTPNDVWLWTPQFLAHFNGATWEQAPTALRCWRIGDGSDNEGGAATVTPDGSIWFMRCHGGDSQLVRFEPKTRVATELGVPHAWSLVRVGAEIGVTNVVNPDEYDVERKYELRSFDVDGKAKATVAVQSPTLRASFDDGVSVYASLRQSPEIERVRGTNTTTIKMPGYLEAAYAPSSHEIWAGGKALYRWRDGAIATIAYRPEAKIATVGIIEGSSVNDIWVGSSVDRDSVPATKGPPPGYRLSHWDGKSWKQTELPKEEGAQHLLALGPKEAWVTTMDELYRWDGKAWTLAGKFPDHHGRAIAVTDDAVWVLGNSTIYRRARTP